MLNKTSHREAYYQYLSIVNKLYELEEKAGIKQQTIHCKDNEEIRDSYFNIEDLDLRKKLIKFRRQYDRLNNEYQPEGISSTRNSSANSTNKYIRIIHDHLRQVLCWIIAMCLAIAFVYIGNQNLEFTSVLYVAIIGIFMGMFFIEKTRIWAATKPKIKSRMKRKKENNADDYQDIFSLKEEESGLQNVPLD